MWFAHEQAEVLLRTPRCGHIYSALITQTTPRKSQGIIFLPPIAYQDIRATEVDKAEVAKSLRPGDIIRARVISLGDSTQYFLSTAENGLGVRWAKSAAGAIMIPISWQVCSENDGTDHLTHLLIADKAGSPQANNFMLVVVT